jgi:hypothetical protein
MATPPAQTGAYQLFAQFSGVDGACTNAVFLLPPSYTYGQSSSFTLQYLYTGTGSTLPLGTSNDDFSISLWQSGGGSPNQTNVQVTVTLLGNNKWNCASSARATLMSNFTSFLLWIETNLELAGNLVPGATVMIGQQIAANIPAPPLETLFYQYGLVTGFTSGTTPSINVMPGMQIRVDTEVSQFISPGSGFNGYVGAGSFTYDIASIPPTSGATRLVAFDPFLGTISTPKINSPSPTMAGGVIDLEPVGGAKSYWKLFYPATMTPPGSAGQNGIANNVALVGAATLNDLNTALTNYPSSCTSATTCAYFLGRTIVVPSIPIFISVRGLFAVEWVPVGTTFRNVIERYLPIFPSGVTATLGRGGANVKFNALTTTPLVDPREYDVPLISGDVVTPTFS